MSKDPHPQRRDFLKTAAATAAGAIGMSALKFDKVQAQSTGGWVAGMQINPAIDNKRVICCHDPKMLTAVPTNKDFTSTNNAIAGAVVAANLD
jgi:anaerobic selenocysteine-containing dehydrogenase